MVQSSDTKLRNIPVRRGAILFALLWTVIISGSLAWNLHQEHQAILNQAISEGNANFDKDTVYRRWSSLHGGVYVPVSEHTPPSPYLSHIPERDITTPSGRRLTLMNPAYMTRQVQELSELQYGVKGHITSLRTLRPGNEPDDWEKKALQSFHEGQKEASEVEIMDGIPYLRFMRPFFTEEGCLQCHDHQGYILGDLRGGISVSVPMDKYYALRKAQAVTLSIWHLILYFIGLSGIFLSARLLHKRIIENEKINENLVFDQERVNSLLALSGKFNLPENELIDFALEEAVRITHSDVGYFHFYDEDSATIHLLRWSRNVMASCAVAESESAYPLENAGIWADCIRQRKAIVHNDYAMLANKKGLPDGHFSIKRHMSVAITDGDHIVAVAGVGNKDLPYDEGDVNQLTLYMGRAWQIIKDNRSKSILEERQDQLKLFRQLIDQSNDAIFIVSTDDGHFLDVNGRASEMLQYDYQELITLGVQDIDVGVPEEFTWEGHIAELRDLPHMLLDSVHRRKDGSTFPVEINVRLFKQNNSEYMIAAARDITDRKNIEKELLEHRDNLERIIQERTDNLAARTKELERSQKALQYLLEDVNEAKEKLETANVKLQELDRLKSMFIASMSHELRTPLNSIIGFSGIILGDMAGEINDEQRDMLSRVSRAGNHLLSLITDIIDIAKIESGKIIPYPEKFPLDMLIDEAVGQIKASAMEKGITVLKKMPDMPVVMHTDRRRLLQCLLNYLSNGVKFSEKGTITVEVTSTGTKAEGTEAQKEKQAGIPEGWIEISVTDTGMGIREEDMKLLFGSFVRLDSPMKTTIPGTGLGLYLTKKITSEVLDGEVGAESKEGEGSRFWLRIPLVLQQV